MNSDKMMEQGYTAVRDKSKDRYASSEDEMEFNHSQALSAAGIEDIHTSDGMPLVNITKNPNITTRPWS